MPALLFYFRKKQMKLNKSILKNLIMEVLEESAYDDLPQGYGGAHPVETEKEPELSGKDLIMSRLSSASPRYGGADYLYWLKKLVSEVGEEQAEADISLVKAPAQKAIRSFLQQFAGRTFADTLSNWSGQFTRV
tara:strand:- start:861 stop:1262 length:402 start_codon:yes stop_codon:yes gene_type:complete